jgi:hypothetical protein
MHTESISYRDFDIAFNQVESVGTEIRMSLFFGSWWRFNPSLVRQVASSIRQLVEAQASSSLLQP